MFQGMRVLELATVLAGPSVGQFFAELGADVIKVENIRNGGDVTRSWKGKRETTDDVSAYFSSVNWGKRSLALDLTTQQDQKIVHELVRTSEVVLASYKPGDAKKLSVDYETLKLINPSVIYGQITGYGSGNPRVGYDAIVQAEAGFMFMNGVPGGPSLKMPVALIDVLAAHHLKEGLLLALLNKQRTGYGALVDVSLFDAAISSLVNQGTNWLVAGHSPGKQGSLHPNIAPYGETFTTSDGREVLLAIGNDRQFQDLCSILDLSTVARDARFRNNVSRVGNRDALREALHHAISSRSSEVFLDACHSKNIPVGQIRSVSEALSSDDVSDMLLVNNSLKGLRTLAAKSRFISSQPILPPPHLGQHNDEVLTQLGKGNA